MDERQYTQLRKDAYEIALSAIEKVKPDEAVKRALGNLSLSGGVYLVAVGKAAWQMANAAVRYLQGQLEAGIVLTKYRHVMGNIPGVICYEAGHPVPDENSYLGTQAILNMTKNLTKDDTVLFLLSGGGSALFEQPLVAPDILQKVTNQMLASGADIVQINTIRKRLSSVKGGKFAEWCAPAKIETIILSDILGDPLDMIASGPTAADSTTCKEALAIAEQYSLILDDSVRDSLRIETPKTVDNVHNQVVGSVKELCLSAANVAQQLGYETVILTDCLDCEAKDAGVYLGELLKQNHNTNKKIAYIAGGETVVRVTGNGLGGRNQELALSAAKVIAGISNIALISVGSDGTDGPTDAAGGFVDGNTIRQLVAQNVNYSYLLENNDSYHALQVIGNLVITGPTGTNVNDVVIGLVWPTSLYCD